MEVWNGHPILLHRFIKSNGIAVRFIANGDNRSSPQPTKIQVKTFQIYAGFNEVNKLNWNQLRMARRNFSLGHASAMNRIWRKNTPGR